jgi:hypothetical protein
MEKEVQTLKFEKGMSFIEARKLVKSRTPRSDFSYSAAVSSKPSVKCIGTQTENPPLVKNKTDATIQSLKTTTTETKNISHDKVAESHTQPTKSNNTKKRSKLDTKTSQNNPTAISTSIPTTKKITVKRPMPSKIPHFKSQPLKSSKMLTKKDFLKTPPSNHAENVHQMDDTIKAYVSAEEEMLTDDASGSDVDLQCYPP